MQSPKKYDLEIQLVTPNDYQKVSNFFDRHFSRDEPLSNCAEPDEDKPQLGDGELMSLIEHGTCLMAIINDTQELAGVALSLSPIHKEVEYNQPQSGDPIGVKIEKFLRKLENDADLFQRYKVNRILYLISICVDSEMRGKGIGGQLCNAVTDLAKCSGFELVAADCTSFYSAKILERLGWDCVNTVFYKDYCDDENNPVFQPPPPHQCCKTYAVRL